MSKKKSPAVVFDRVSSADQRDGFSLEAQKALSEKYAKEGNLIIVKRWSKNESASKEDERKFFFEMIEYVKEHDIKDVIFDKVDRACRGLKSAQLIEELIEQHGVRFHFTRDRLTIDVNSPSTEKLRFYLHVILAKYYIDNLKGEIKKGMEQREVSGFWNHKAPLGYKNVRLDESGKVSGDKKGRAIVHVDDAIAPHVSNVFELYSTGNYGYRELNEILSANLSDRKIAMSYIEDLISNPFYYGAMRVKGNVIQGKHPPLITKKLWDACQKVKGIRGENHHIRTVQDVPKPFMGLMRCGTCNHSITGQVKRKAKGAVYVYYHCANHNCPERHNYVPEGKIAAQVAVAFEPFTKLTLKATEMFLKGIQDSLGNIELYTQKTMLELLERQQVVKQKMESIEQLRRDGTLDEEGYQGAISAKRNALAENEVQMQAAIKSNGETFSRGRAVIELLPKGNDFMKLSDDWLEKARLAKIVLSNSTLKDGILRYDYQNPFDVLIELTTKKNWWSHQESNLEQSFRKAPLYPFNYGSMKDWNSNLHSRLPRGNGVLCA